MKRNRKSADHNLMRNINRSLILSGLRTSPPQSRANLAARTGLTRSTISSLVDELIAARLVHEIGIGPSYGGRPGTLLELNPEGGCAIGVEITSDAVTDFVAQPRWQRGFELETNDLDTVIGQTEQLIDEALCYNDQVTHIKPLGIGVGVGGLVDVAEGVLKSASNLGWHDIPFKTSWEQRYNLPVYVGNEASIAALGENYFGAAAGYSDFIYLGASRRAVGAGIFINGKLYQGMSGYAGEVGHMVIDPQGSMCPCGRRGCWEAEIRAACDLRPLRERLQTAVSSQILEITKGDFSAIRLRTVIAAARAGDALASEMVTRINDVLALGIANLIVILNPQLVVLGGSLGMAIEPFVPAIRTATIEQLTVSGDGIAQILPSAIPTNACVMGAVALVLDDILSEPLL